MVDIAEQTPADRATLAREAERRRSFAIISHPDVGKTTLTEKLLLYAKAIHLAGSVKARRAARHTISDWMKPEPDLDRGRLRGRRPVVNLATALRILVVTHGVDAALTHAQGKKGLMALDDKLATGRRTAAAPACINSSPSSPCPSHLARSHGAIRTSRHPSLSVNSRGAKHQMTSFLPSPAIGVGLGAS